MPECYSKKHSQVIYANLQGFESIKKELRDKNIMKKNDRSIKPIVIENLEVNYKQIVEIKERFTNNPEFKVNLKEKLQFFDKLTSEISN